MIALSFSSKRNSVGALINWLPFLILFLIPGILKSQSTMERPTVGLVLSGGGAHGIAHLGVIKVMEEAGLRPDYITGVSMGSIIGGMYSLGYTADSLQYILKTTNWDIILSNKIPENKVIFLEKERFNNSIISLPITSRKVILPSGLINGQQVENILSYYTWPAADINDFSKLPIPFMCVATDIKNYKIVDLKTGYLSDAIRASFSVPSIFTPIKIDSLLLLDGGLIRNFAASEAEEMGADIIIGSYVGFERKNEEELQTVSGIMKQIGMFRSLSDFEEQKKLVDILIKPQIDDLSITNFGNIDTLIRRGYEAALPYKKHFRRIADSLNLISAQKPLKYILDKQSYKFNKIEITGNEIYSNAQILGVLDINAGESVDRKTLTDRIELLYGKAWFEKVKYRIVPRNDSLVLVIDCIEKPQAIVYGSVHYDNSLKSGVILGLSVKNLLIQRSVLDINSFIGEYFRLEINSTQFIDKNQKYGLAANFFTDNTLIPMLELRGENGDVLSRNFTSGLSINRRLGLNHMMSLSTYYENLYLILRYNADSHIKNLSYNFITTRFDYQINTINTRHFPDEGILANFYASTSKLISAGIRTDSSKTVLEAADQSDFSFERFFTLHGSIRQYFSTSSKLTFSIGGEILYITDSDSVSALNNLYFLGGTESFSKRSLPMTGYHPNQIPVKKLAGLRSEMDYEFFPNFHINLMADIFAVQDVNQYSGFSLVSGYGAGIGYMSIIGPIKIGIMYGDKKNGPFFSKTKGFISIGYKF